MTWNDAKIWQDAMKIAVKQNEMNEWWDKQWQKIDQCVFLKPLLVRDKPLKIGCCCTAP